MEVEQHWVFAAFCAALILLLVRHIAHERITLQSSLASLALLAAMIAAALFPNITAWIGKKLGFAPPSNFLFAVGIGALAVLNIATLVTLSRVELRSIALTQELGLLREKLEGLAPAPAKGPE